ncbi:MAG: sigma-70 family RNA polymerase sigma factor [Elusimicrobia bacterium]|nr:sigma-70 family RNA polymerase sigma factor [Elusimicrobiota bacterium]MDE2237958.1 sigma-70 family RNA polymerase sigma factor [Elusimicrobiota bacterium]MDE2424805.1 sigma-70 family RNA polymerase sigma factor [Elusimicrobiota bacterium]
MRAERELIEKSRAGDAEAFGLLMRRYEDRVYRLAKSVCAALPAESDDVYQETFLTAFKKLGGFRSQSGLGTWLYRIASNLCLMRHRKKRREPLVSLPERSSAGEDSEALQFSDRELTPEELAGKRELLERVGAALAELSVEQRMVVVLRDIEGLSNERTARVLKLGLAAVKSRLHRARGLLKEKLERSLEPSSPATPRMLASRRGRPRGGPRRKT